MHQINTLLLRCLTAIFFVLAACTSARAASTPQVDRLLLELNNCRSWNTARVNKAGQIESSDALAIMSVLNKVAELNKMDVRSFISKYLSQPVKANSQMSVWSNVYVFNRLYFSVPQTSYDKNDFHKFGMWFVPEKEKNNPAWPLVDVDGKLMLRGVFFGYAGPPYQGLAEFDYFSNRYSVRKLLK